MSAMKEEIRTLLQHLKNPKSYTKGKRRYHIGTLFNKEVVLVFSRWGKIASATTTTQLINDFELDEIIFTGVAGSISSELNIGDIVIGKNLFQHDIDASPLYKKFEVPLLNKTFFETESSKRIKLLASSRQFVDDFRTVITKNEATKFNIQNPKVIKGDIASGDQFINTKSQINFLHSNLQSVVCVEMEGASVAQVCYEYQVPFSIIRIISDNANDNAHIDFELFADQIASKYALKILEHYLK